MLRFSTTLALALTLGAAPVFAEKTVDPEALADGEAEATNEDALARVVYTCKDEAQLEVVYFNSAAGNSFAVMSYGGELIPMEQMVMASGAAYAAMDDTLNLKLFTKGDEAFVEENDAATDLSDCKADS